MKNLKGKVAIITGGGAGIGAATARLFLEEGAKVLLVDIAEEKLESVKQELNSDNVAYFKADVSKSDEVKRYVDYAVNTFGAVDILFSNAGIEGTVSPILLYPETVFDQVIDVNLKGVWLSLQHTIPVMNDGGSVIITSSVAGLKGFEGLGAYVASKHAVIGIMRTAAIEFAPRKIRVNSVHPGPVDNQMMRRIENNISPTDADQVKKGFEDSSLLGRYSTSAEIAELVLFLASDKSSNVTGCPHVMDGGLVVA